MTNDLPLRYGENPDQAWARASAVDGGELPFSVVQGEPSYTNLLDALQGWRIVAALDVAFGTAAAASVKHANPAGAAVARPERGEGVGAAYARARAADPLASFGDFAAFSRPLDAGEVETITSEVAHGAIAPGFSGEALERLRAKRNGRFIVLQIDPTYAPPAVETREVFGVRLEQQSEGRRLTRADFVRIATRKAPPPAAVSDLLLAAIVARHTISNAIVLARGGQVIGAGGGQQSRIAAARLACEKAEQWWLRRHPLAASASSRPGESTTARNNRIDELLRSEQLVTEAERMEWISRLDEIACASDGFIPFPDTIARLAQAGIRYLAQPGGSSGDAAVTTAADNAGMAMCHTGVRLFRH